MPVPTLTTRLFSLISRHPWPVLALSVLLATLSLVYTARNLEFLTNRDDLMPAHAQFQMDYQAYRTNFGDPKEIAIVVEAGDPALVSRFCDTLYTRLSGEQQLFIEVLYPGGLDYFRQNGLLFMPLQQLQKMAQTIELAGPVLRELAAAPSIQTLFSALTSQIDDYLLQPTPSKLHSLTFMLGTLDKGFNGFNAKKPAISMDSLLGGGSDGEASLLETDRKSVV